MVNNLLVREDLGQQHPGDGADAERVEGEEGDEEDEGQPVRLELGAHRGAGRQGRVQVVAAEGEARDGHAADGAERQRPLAAPRHREHADHVAAHAQQRGQHLRRQDEGNIFFDASVQQSVFSKPT